MAVEIITPSTPSIAVSIDRTSTASGSSLFRPAGSSPNVGTSSLELQVTTSDQISNRYRSLSDTTAKINHVATSVRQADAVMDRVGQTIDKMKGTLEEIVKNYPPFPPGSEQRVRALKGFAALRHEIEEMTFPPEQSLVPKLISDPVRSPGTFSVTLDSNGTRIQLDRQQIDPGPKGLNIPSLPVMPPEDSGDEHIHKAISSLKTAAITISERRQTLSDNFTQRALPAVTSSLTTQTALSGSVPSISPESASSISQGISGIFSSIPVGISSDSDSLLKRIT